MRLKGRFLFILTLLGLVFIIGILGYMFIEGWGFLDAAYMNRHHSYLGRL